MNPMTPEQQAKFDAQVKDLNAASVTVGTGQDDKGTYGPQGNALVILHKEGVEVVGSGIDNLEALGAAQETLATFFPPASIPQPAAGDPPATASSSPAAPAPEETTPSDQLDIQSIPEAPGFFQAALGSVKKFFMSVGNKLEDVKEDVVKAAIEAKAKIDADLQAAGRTIQKDVAQVLDAIEAPAVNERNERFGTLAKALAAAGYKVSIGFPDNGHDAQVTICDKDGNELAKAMGADKVYAIENAIALAKLQQEVSK